MHCRQRLPWGIPLDSLDDGFIGDDRRDNTTPELFAFYNYVLDHMEYEQKYYGDGTSSSYDMGFHFFSDSLYRKAPTEACKRCFEKYPLIFIKDNRTFCKMAFMFAQNRTDDLFEFALQLKRDSNEPDRNHHLQNCKNTQPGVPISRLRQLLMQNRQ